MTYLQKLMCHSVYILYYPNRSLCFIFKENSQFMEVLYTAIPICHDI